MELTNEEKTELLEQYLTHQERAEKEQLKGQYFAEIVQTKKTPTERIDAVKEEIAKLKTVKPLAE